MEERVTGYVLVVEHGVRWIPAVVQPGCSATERVFITQAPKESAKALAGRVARHAEDLAKNVIPIECAVIAVSDAEPAKVLTSRYRMARALLCAMGGAPRARLHFASPLLLGDEARHSLLSIVGTLTAELQNLSAEICIRFGPSSAELHSVLSVQRGFGAGELSFGAA